MSNELMLLAELLVVYALILVFWRLWGKVGLVCWLGIATILANIEVLILVDCFHLRANLRQYFICLDLYRHGYFK